MQQVCGFRSLAKVAFPGDRDAGIVELPNGDLIASWFISRIRDRAKLKQGSLWQSESGDGGKTRAMAKCDKILMFIEQYIKKR